MTARYSNAPRLVPDPKATNQGDLGSELHCALPLNSWNRAVEYTIRDISQHPTVSSKFALLIPSSSLRARCLRTLND